MTNEDELSWTVPSPDKVCAVEFSPFPWSSSLLAVGTTMRVTIFNCKFKVRLCKFGIKRLLNTINIFDCYYLLEFAGRIPRSR